MQIKWSLPVLLFLSLIGGWTACRETDVESGFSFSLCSENFLLIEIDPETRFWLGSYPGPMEETALTEPHFLEITRWEEGFDHQTRVLLLNYREKRGEAYRICFHNSEHREQWLSVSGSHLELTAPELLRNAELIRFGPILSRPDEGAKRLRIRSLACVKVVRVLEDWLEVGLHGAPCHGYELPILSNTRRGFVKWREGNEMLVKIRF